MWPNRNPLRCVEPCNRVHQECAWGMARFAKVCTGMQRWAMRMSLTRLPPIALPLLFQLNVCEVEPNHGVIAHKFLRIAFPPLISWMKYLSIHLNGLYMSCYTLQEYLRDNFHGRFLTGHLANIRPFLLIIIYELPVVKAFNNLTGASMCLNAPQCALMALNMLHAFSTRFDMLLYSISGIVLLIIIYIEII